MDRIDPSMACPDKSQVISTSAVLVYPYYGSLPLGAFNLSHSFNAREVGLIHHLRAEQSRADALPLFGSWVFASSRSLWIACENSSLAQRRILSVVRYEWSRAKTGRDKSAIDNDDDDSVDPGAYVRYI
jgi:hypothetical protein